MSKQSIGKRLPAVLAAVACALILCIGVAYADTDGTEMQVAQPSQLEIQLGAAWAGVEFQLRTDAGVYPGTITVDDTGILKMEIGGSESYILSCLDSPVAAPEPEITSEAPADTTSPVEIEPQQSAVKQQPEPEEEAVVSGIPVKHIIFFAGGLVLAVGSLVALRIVKKRGAGSRQAYEEDDEDFPD